MVMYDSIIRIQGGEKMSNEKLILDELQKLNSRFDSLEGRFDNLEGRFDNLENRFNNMENRVETLEKCTEQLQVAQQQTITKLENSVSKAITALIEGYNFNAERLKELNIDALIQQSNQAVVIAKLANERVSKLADKVS